jgi:hypothetical protein
MDTLMLPAWQTGLQMVNNQFNDFILIYAGLITNLTHLSGSAQAFSHSDLL